MMGTTERASSRNGSQRERELERVWRKALLHIEQELPKKKGAYNGKAIASAYGWVERVFSGEEPLTAKQFGRALDRRFVSLFRD